MVRCPTLCQGPGQAEPQRRLGEEAALQPGRGLALPTPGLPSFLFLHPDTVALKGWWDPILF